MKKNVPTKKARRAGSVKTAAKKRGSARKKSETSSLSAPSLDRGEIKSLLSLKHGDPHAILGAHYLDGGIMIRAFRPDAEKIDVLIGKKKPQPMTRIHDAGLFEIAIPELSTIPPYRFQVTYSNDNTFIQRDAYAFLPTLGDLDLHLFAEGRHERVYEKLGAHPRKVGR